MAIQKMKLISIAGMIDDFDRVVSDYLTKYDLHLENALNMLDNVKGLSPFAADTSAAELIKVSETLLESGNISEKKDISKSELSASEIAEKLNEITEKLKDVREEIKDIDSRSEETKQILNQLEHMQGLNVELDKIFKCSFIKFRFGKLPKAGYEKLKTYLDDINAIFLEGDSDRDYVYGVYFVPKPDAEKIDAVFGSLYFKRIFISEKACGTPKNAYELFSLELERLANDKEKLKSRLGEIISDDADEILSMHEKLKTLNQAEEIKKYAAKAKDSFYILAWAPKKTAEKLEKDIKNDVKLVVIEESPDIIKNANPPVKLKNIGLFRPFKMFVEMYGLPSYTELDPTPLLALTYIIMFGIMFGDAGHGLILLFGGLLLYKLKKMDLAAIVSQAGFFATIFGLIYGSFFGNEEILHEISFTKRFFLINPMKDITTVLILAVALGVVIILISMLLNIVNCLRNKNWGKALFSKDGVAGMVFYVWVIFMVANMLILKLPVPAGLSPAIIIITLLLIFFSEPLTELLDGNPDWLPKNVGEFILETFFELFEIILSYVTNTISFVRLGAFALGHGSMMSVVFILADMVGGPASIIVLILGNALVIGLEGLVVGIQALRLEFYEMFSRYYTGGGRPFVSINKPL